MRIYINHLWMVPPQPWSNPPDPPNKFETRPFSMYSPPTARTFLLGTGAMWDAGVTATANKESYHDNFERLPRQSAGCKHDNSHDKNSLYGSTALWKESVKSLRGSTAL